MNLSSRLASLDLFRLLEAGVLLAGGLAVAVLLSPAVALCLLLPLGGGLVGTYAYDPGAPPLSRPFTGAVAGLLLFALVGLSVGLVRGLDEATVLVAALAAGAPLLGLGRASLRTRIGADLDDLETAASRLARRPTLSALAAIAAALATGLLLWSVLDHVMVENAAGISTGYINNLGDLPFHFSLVTSFAYGANLPPTDPMYAGTALTYPFLADYLSAMFLVAGSNLRECLFWPNLLLGAGTIGLMVRWTAALTRSRLAAALAPLLLLVGGGLGWLMLADDARTSGAGVFAAILSPTHDYTILGDSIWRWGNAVTTLLVTQRSLLFGLPVVLLIFTLVWQSLSAPTSPGWRDVRGRLLFVAGLATGSLALVHTHSLLVVLGTTFLQGLLFREWRAGRWRAWLLYLAGVALLAGPGLLLLTVGSSASVISFVGIAFGWDHGTNDPILFWIANTGLFVPLLLAGLLIGRLPGIRGRAIAENRLVLFLLPFAVWFILPNLFRLAPWIWDNIKVLFYWWVGFVPLVALVLARAWERTRAAGRSLVVVAILSLTLAGSINIWWAVSGQSSYGEYDGDALAFAAAVRADTPANALILADPTWNVPVFLTGRRVLLGYPGQVWSRGYSYTARQADITTIYAGGPGALALLRQYGFGFVEVTPLERADLKVSDSFLASLRPIAQVGAYQLFEVPHE